MSAAPKASLFLSYELEVVKGPHAGQKFNFDKPVVTIGRGNENHVVLAQDLRVSRVHAEIKNSDGQLYFTNVSQKNYVLVDGIKTEFHQLSRDCTLMIGESEIRFKILESGGGKALTPAPRPLRPVPPVAPMAAAAKPMMGMPHSMPTPHLASRPSGGQAFSMPKPLPQKENRMRFYLIIGVVGLIIYFAFFNGEKAKTKKDSIRNSEAIEKELQKSQEQIDRLEAKINRQNNVTYKRAEENFIKGFRDYQKGQYVRAREYFRIVLNLIPDHAEARKYYEQATIKHHKRMEFNFIEGLKNKERKNYRLCKSFFSQVLILAQGDRSSYEKYDEAEKYLHECSLGLEGRF